MPFSQIPTASPVIRMRIGDLVRSNYSRFGLYRLFGGGEGIVPASQQGASSVGDTEKNAKTATTKETKAVKTQEVTADENKAAEKVAKTKNFDVGMIVNLKNAMSLTPIATDSATEAVAGQGPVNLTAAVNLKISKVVTKGTTGAGATDTSSPSGTTNQDSAVKPGTTAGTFKVEVNATDVGGAKVKSVDAEYDVGDGKKKTAPGLAPEGSTPFFILEAISGDELSLAPEANTAAQATDVQAAVAAAVPEPPPPNPNGVKAFMAGAESNKPNAIVRSFEATMSKGLAGIITALDFGYNESTWETTAIGSKAPMSMAVTMMFTVIHDITPGLDADGFMRAPTHPIGKVVNSTFGSPGLPPHGVEPTAAEQNKAEATT
jgi:hypothetical protein